MSIRTLTPSPIQRTVRLAIRPDPARPNHNLWWNKTCWHIDYVIYDGATRRRPRFSLKTADVDVARQRRDAIFAGLRSAA